MRAVVRRGTTLSVDTVADPVPGAGEVLSRTLACGICGSDLHILHHADHVIALANSAGGHTWMDPSADVVFGHEFCTEIVDVGPGTEQRFKSGTQVCAVPFVLGRTGPEIVG
ncbi:MAG: alcohol dehydrogenase catalytic domain-containing protein, partial [Pseudomonadota bacterium]